METRKRPSRARRGAAWKPSVARTDGSGRDPPGARRCDDMSACYDHPVSPPFRFGVSDLLIEATIYTSAQACQEKNAKKCPAMFTRPKSGGHHTQFGLTRLFWSYGLVASTKNLWSLTVKLPCFCTCSCMARRRSRYFSTVKSSSNHGIALNVYTTAPMSRNEYSG